jgi:hypothetical protein
MTTKILPLYDAKGQIPVTDAQKYAYQNPFYIQVFCRDGKLIIADESEVIGAETMNAICAERWFYATSH